MITRFTGRARDPSIIVPQHRNASATSGLAHSGKAGFVRSVIVWLIGRPACGALFPQAWILNDGLPYFLGLLSLLSTILCYYPVTFRSPIVWAEERGLLEGFMADGCFSMERLQRDLTDTRPLFV